MLGRLFEKTSLHGNRYFVGRFGTARLVMLADQPTEDGQPVWRLLAQELPAKVETTTKRPSIAPPRRKAVRSPRPPDPGPPLFDDTLDDLWPEVVS